MVYAARTMGGDVKKSAADFSQTNRCQIPFIDRNLGFFPTKTTKQEDENHHKQTRESCEPCALGGKQTRLSFRGLEGLSGLRFNQLLLRTL